MCLLSRSLYGLKQAPRAWYQRIAGFLQTLGFSVTRSDASLFVYRHGDTTAYLLLYVDDIILTASSAALLQQITLRLRHEFAIKDLGALHYFLGIEIVRRPDGFCISKSMRTSSLSVLACSTVILLLLLLTRRPRFLLLRARQRRMLPSTGPLSVLFTI